LAWGVWLLEDEEEHRTTYAGIATKKKTAFVLAIAAAAIRPAVPFFYTGFLHLFHGGKGEFGGVFMFVVGSAGSGADDVSDFHKSGGVVTLGFGEFVENEPDGFLQLRDDDVLEHINPSPGHL
jgi:hypothetical protein